MIKKTFYPSNRDVFKAKLLITKRATRILIYKDGHEKVEIWNASNFTAASNLMRNVSSQLGHKKDKADIVEAIYEISEEEDSFEDARQVTDLYISYKRAWESFRERGEHPIAYCIENNIITVSYEVFFTPSRTVSKKIPARDMRVLLSILNQAVATHAFATAQNNPPAPVHGSNSYDYDYASLSGRNCHVLFTNNLLARRYQALIDKLTR